MRPRETTPSMCSTSALGWQSMQSVCWPSFPIFKLGFLRFESMHYLHCNIHPFSGRWFASVFSHRLGLGLASPWSYWCFPAFCRIYNSTHSLTYLLLLLHNVGFHSVLISSTTFSRDFFNVELSNEPRGIPCLWAVPLWVAFPATFPPFSVRLREVETPMYGSTFMKSHTFTSLVLSKHFPVWCWDLSWNLTGRLSCLLDSSICFV